MCLICERIEMIDSGSNPHFVKELETGHVVIGDHQHFKGYTLFLCKEHVTELHHLSKDFRDKHLSETADISRAVSHAFSAENLKKCILKII